MQTFQRDGVWKTLDQIKKPVVEEPVVEPVSEPKKRFCEFCDSKGHFHKKGCTRNIDNLLD